MPWSPLRLLERLLTEGSRQPLSLPSLTKGNWVGGILCWHRGLSLDPESPTPQKHLIVEPTGGAGMSLPPPPPYPPPLPLLSSPLPSLPFSSPHPLPASPANADSLGRPLTTVLPLRASMHGCCMHGCSLWASPVVLSQAPWPFSLSRFLHSTRSHSTRLS